MVPGPGPWWGPRIFRIFYFFFGPTQSATCDHKAGTEWDVRPVTNASVSLGD